MRLLILAAVACVASRTASGGPPYTTDDPETPEASGLEINIPYTADRTPSQNLVWIPLFDVNYGLLDSVEATLEVPVQRVSGSGTPRATGCGDLLLGLKWRFLEEDAHTVQLAVSPQVQLPTGDSNKGLGTGKAAYILALLGEKNVGRWTTFGNLGYVAQSACDTLDYWYYGGALNRQINSRLALGGELFGSTATAPDAARFLAAALGTEFSLSKKHILLFSVGHSLQGEPTWVAYAGLQVEIGGWQRKRRKVAELETPAP